MDNLHLNNNYLDDRDHLVMGIVLDCSKSIDEEFDGDKSYKEIIEDSINKFFKALKKDQESARYTHVGIYRYDDEVTLLEDYSDITEKNDFSFITSSESLDFSSTIESVVYHVNETCTNLEFQCRKPKIIVITSGNETNKRSDFPYEQFMNFQQQKGHDFDLIIIPLNNSDEIYEYYSQFSIYKPIKLAKPDNLIDFFKFLFSQITTLYSKRVIEYKEYDEYFEIEDEDYDSTLKDLLEEQYE